MNTRASGHMLRITYRVTYRSKGRVFQKWQ